MNPSPLRLENYFFTKLKVEADLLYRGDNDPSSPVAIDCKANVLKNNDEPRKWQVHLDLATSPEAPAGKTPYRFELTAVGFIETTVELDDRQAAFMVQVNGASLLYTAAREFLLMVTGRGPWPAAMLPTTSFIPPAVQIVPAEKPAGPEKRKKK